MDHLGLPLASSLSATAAAASSASATYDPPDVGDGDEPVEPSRKRKRSSGGGFQSFSLLPFLFKGVMRLGYQLPTPVQRKVIPLLLAGHDVVAMARTGSGKCFARGTQLRLYSGDLIAVERIVGGELLMGDDGGPRTVTPGSLTPPGSSGVLYTVTPHWEGARPFTVNADHILVLANNTRPSCRATTGQGRSPAWTVDWYELDSVNGMRCRSRSYATEGEAKDELEALTANWTPLVWEVTVRDFLAATSRVRRACQLMAADAVTFVNPQLPSLKHVLGVVLGVAATQAQIDWAAWYLGLWLTDGYADSADVSLCGPPKGQPGSQHEIVAELHRYQQLFAQQVTQRHEPWSTAHHDVSCFHFGQPAPLGVRGGGSLSIAHRLLQQYGLISTEGIDNKHVPQAWMCDTLDVRRHILAGIVDGDGCCAEQSGCYEITAKQLRVAQGCKLLGASLGLRTGAITVKTSVDKMTGERYDGHRLSFFGHLHTVSLHIVCSHKQSPQPGAASYRAPNEDSRCYGFSITQQPAGEYFGFAVTGANRRFLLEDFTITHNVSQPQHAAAASSAQQRRSSPLTLLCAMLSADSGLPHPDAAAPGFLPAACRLIACCSRHHSLAYARAGHADALSADVPAALLPALRAPVHRAADRRLVHERPVRGADSLGTARRHRRHSRASAASPGGGRVQPADGGDAGHGRG